MKTAALLWLCLIFRHGDKMIKMIGTNMISEKKALLRIVEAVLAIVIIASISVYLYNQQVRKPNIQDDIYNLEDSILREISSNNELREDVLKGNLTNINKTIELRMPNSLEFTTRICEPEEVCGMATYLGLEKEVYAKDTFISATLEIYSPKKFKIFVWVK